MVKAAFLGLGVMGYPMARHLSAKGHEVTVYNRTTAKAEKWVSEHGGRLAATPAEAAAGQDLVFACVGNDDDLRAITLERMVHSKASPRGQSLSTTPQPRPRSRANSMLRHRLLVLVFWMRQCPEGRRAQRMGS